MRILVFLVLIRVDEFVGRQKLTPKFSIGFFGGGQVQRVGAAAAPPARTPMFRIVVTLYIAFSWLQFPIGPSVFSSVV